MGKVARASVLALGLVGCRAVGARDPITDQGRRVGDLWGIFYVAGIVVAGIVGALILWCLVRYRASRPGDPAQFRASVPAEIAYGMASTYGAFGIAVALYHRFDSRKGQYINVSMHESAGHGRFPSPCLCRAYPLLVQVLA